jgi:hypothetical protein
MARHANARVLAASLAMVFLILSAGSVALSGHIAEATPPSTAASQHFNLKIVALVDYLALPVGLECDYGQGSANLTIGRSDANVSLSVQGDVPNRDYNVVVITNEGNMSIGAMKIDSNGTGTFSGSARLLVGPTALSQIAIRLYYTGPVPVGCFSLDLVGLPFPVMIVGSGTISTSTTTARTSTASTTISATSIGPTISISKSHSSSSTQTSTTTSNSSTVSTVSTTSGSSTTGAGVFTSLNFRLVSLPEWLLLPEPLNYPFLSGTANVTIEGNNLLVDVTIAGAANTRFIVDVSANDKNITLGTVLTTRGGTNNLVGDVQLSNGTYLVGIRVYQAAQPSVFMASSSLVAVSIPLAEPVVIGSGSTTTTTSSTGSTTTASTTNQTLTSTASSSQSQNAFSYFSLNLVTVAGIPGGYVRGSGTFDVDLLNGVLDVSVQLDRANPNTTYGVVLQLGGSNVTLGTFVTDSAGDAELDTEVPAGSGTYAATVLVYDDSSFHSPTLVMTGTSGQVSIATTSSSTTTVQTQTQRPAIISIAPNAIASAVANGTIPAEVQISSSGQNLDIIDHSFSVSVGRVSDRGVAITVSGQNITGPRTFLIDVNGSLAQSITSGSFEILFDGQQISEASSVSAVLSPQPGAQATYAVVQTSGGVQLLVSVPHFSTHVIEILGVSFQSVKGLLEVSLPILVGAVVAVTLIFGAIYASRRRV